MWLIDHFSVSVFPFAMSRPGRERRFSQAPLFSRQSFPFFSWRRIYFGNKNGEREALLRSLSSGVLAAAVGLFQFFFSYLIGIDKSVKIWENLAPYFLGNSFGKIVAANSSWLVNIGGETRMRAFGFFPDPHNFAFFVNLCLFAGLGYFFSQEKSGVQNMDWCGRGT